jgi:hypothetical protein
MSWIDAGQETNMPRSDAFALKNSGLNEFLLAEVGNEVNGSPLTILSVLARLGKDPWTEAARLAKLPKAKTIDYIANILSQMPLSPRALIDARATAARVTSLLPSQSKLQSPPIGRPLVPSVGADCRVGRGRRLWDRV